MDIKRSGVAVPSTGGSGEIPAKSVSSRSGEAGFAHVATTNGWRPGGLSGELSGGVGLVGGFRGGRKRGYQALRRGGTFHGRPRRDPGEAGSVGTRAIAKTTLHAHGVAPARAPRTIRPARAGAGGRGPDARPALESPRRRPPRRIRRHRATGRPRGRAPRPRPDGAIPRGPGRKSVARAPYPGPREIGPTIGSHAPPPPSAAADGRGAATARPPSAPAAVDSLDPPRPALGAPRAPKDPADGQGRTDGRTALLLLGAREARTVPARRTNERRRTRDDRRGAATRREPPAAPPASAEDALPG